MCEINIKITKKNYITPKESKSANKLKNSDWHNKGKSNGHSPSRRRKSKEVEKTRRLNKNNI